MMRTIRILIAEDEPIIAADLEDRLTDMGYEVSAICASGSAAIDFVRQGGQPDLLLMDIHLEGPLDWLDIAPNADFPPELEPILADTTW